MPGGVDGGHGRFDQHGRQARRIERNGKTGADQATADDENGLGLSHSRIIPLRGEGAVAAALCRIARIPR